MSSEVVEAELPWAPFYCFTNPVDMFNVHDGTIEQTDHVPVGSTEMAFPTALHMHDTERNWIRIGTIRDWIHTGRSVKAFTSPVGHILAFGPVATLGGPIRSAEKRQLADRAHRHERKLGEMMNADTHVNAFLLLVDVKRRVKTGPLSPRSVMFLDAYDRNKSRINNTRAKCLDKMRQLRLCMQQNGIEVKI